MSLTDFCASHTTGQDTTRIRACIAGLPTGSVARVHHVYSPFWLAATAWMTDCGMNWQRGRYRDEGGTYLSNAVQSRRTPRCERRSRVGIGRRRPAGLAYSTHQRLSTDGWIGRKRHGYQYLCTYRVTQAGQDQYTLEILLLQSFVRPASSPQLSSSSSLGLGRSPLPFRCRCSCAPPSSSSYWFISPSPSLGGPCSSPSSSSLVSAAIASAAPPEVLGSVGGEAYFAGAATIFFLRLRLGPAAPSASSNSSPG
jgi:hypothetical protein